MVNTAVETALIYWQFSWCNQSFLAFARPVIGPCSSLHEICDRHMGGGFMKMNEFHLLLQEEQVMILYQHGIYIGKVKRDGFTSLLYQLSSFYVEITYARYRRLIKKMVCSDSTAVLDPYLDQIDVEYLVT